VELRDAGLGDAQNLADLPEREVLEVVQRDDQGLALGQVLDRLGEPVLASLVSRAAWGSAALSSSIVSSSEILSPDASGVIQSSSSARIAEFEICSSTCRR
jgi:hypothetical protein